MRYKVTLGGRVYEVEVERGEAIIADEYEAAAPVTAYAAPSPAPAAAAPVPPPAKAQLTEVAGEVVTSPLPGTVLEIQVNQGDTVKKGQLLIIIEAMKMENEIVAPTDGTVIQINVKQGASVNSGDPLVVLG